MPGPILLSADFTLDQACKSQTATRCGIDNAPTPLLIPRLAAVATAILQPVHEYYGNVQISSFYRAPPLNKAVGGAINSQHMAGEAVDIEVPGVTNPDLAEWIAAHLPFDQLILEFYTRGQPYSGWVHVSHIDETAGDNVAYARRNRHEVLTIGHGFTLSGLHP